ncbi:hypothetical protein [Xanthomonas sp. LMG 12461]|uniref:hypothetical protein n=1 Tax=Xanthomonas sp. LMG 12461 TaxID=2014543 RepID=UPI001264C976|nr:hypothetical protein [Xanthomonas sp. LMG 12461]KAB7765370.1 hypothetical protein CEK68_11755 [Xanthomonas sp. LMG 12461]
MSETKWTPGPWLVNTAGVGSSYGGIEVTEFYVYNPKVVKNVAIAADIVDPKTGQPSEANARLISAAPELYEALSRLEQYGHTDATWDFAMRAMAKARGEQ